jgi:hypothetical protein
MNSEDAKTRRNLKRWIQVTGATQTVLFLLLVSPFLWFLFTPSRTSVVVKESRALGKQIRAAVTESNLTDYLANCERDIANGIRSPTNCIPSWLKSLKTSRPWLDASTRFEGTNLCVDAAWASGRGFIGLRLCNQHESHAKDGELFYVHNVFTNCSVFVGTKGY